MHTVSTSNRFSVPGNISIQDFNTHFKTNLPSDEFDTLAGMILHAFGELPAESETIELGTLRFSVAKIEHHRITELLVEDLSTAGTPETPEEEVAAAEPQAETPSNTPDENKQSEVKE